MDQIERLKKQMTVVSNPDYGESIGGYELFFVGVGERQVEFKGWWSTQLDFYSFDATGISQNLRVEGGEDIRKGADIVPLFGPGVFYEEHYDQSGKFDDAWVVFRAKSSSDPLRTIVGSKGFQFFRDKDKIIRQLILATAHIASPDPGMRCLAQSSFLKTISHFLLASERDGQDSLEIGPLIKEPVVATTFRKRILSLLESNLATDLSVDDVARHLSMSRSSVSHRFSTEMGESLVQLKNRLRILRAQKLLQDPDLQIKMVAFQIGIRDPAYFSHLFQKLVGISPNAYRKVVARPQIARKQPQA